MDALRHAHPVILPVVDDLDPLLSGFGETQRGAPLDVKEAVDVAELAPQEGQRRVDMDRIQPRLIVDQVDFALVQRFIASRVRLEGALRQFLGSAQQHGLLLLLQDFVLILG